MKRALALLVACQTTNAVAPPQVATDCASIAEVLASVEIGNYAPAPKRARVVSRLRAACDRADLDDREARCLAVAADRDAAARCTTKLAVAVDCGDVIAKVRASARRPADPSLAAQLDRDYDVMAVACDEDDWPADLRACVLASGRIDACAGKLPKELRDALARRIVDVLQPRP